MSVVGMPTTGNSERTIAASTGNSIRQMRTVSFTDLGSNGRIMNLPTQGESLSRNTSFEEGERGVSRQRTFTSRALRLLRTGSDSSRFNDILNSIQFESIRHEGMEHMPWESEDGTVRWSSPRIAISKVIDTQNFERIMGLVIIFNLALIVRETDLDATCFPEFDGRLDDCPSAAAKVRWIGIADVALLICYSIELSCRLFVWRVEFFTNKWNLLDGVVVFLGWASLGFNTTLSFGFLRIFRMSRLLRAARMLISIPELYLLMTGLKSAVRAIFFGTFILVSMIVLWSILVVQFIHPINAGLEYDDCDECSESYKSVFKSSVTLFQTIVTGDSWGKTSVPIIEDSPWMCILLLSIVVTVSLGVMNLILAVIVERATEARENDVKGQLKKLERERQQTMVRLARMLLEMDRNKDGKITWDELMWAFERYIPFRDTMRQMDVRDISELRSIFDLLDVDGSGDLSSREFVEQLYDIKSRDLRMMVVKLRLILQQQSVVMTKHTAILDGLARKLDVRLSTYSMPSYESGVAQQRSHRQWPMVRGMSSSSMGTYITSGAASATSANNQSNARSDRGTAAVAQHVEITATGSIGSAATAPLGMDELTEELTSMRQQMKEVASTLKTEMLGKVQEQITGIMQGVLTTWNSSDGSASPKRPAIPQPQQIDRIYFELSQLKTNISGKATALIATLEQYTVEEAAAVTLQRLEQLTDSMGMVQVASGGSEEKVRMPATLPTNMVGGGAGGGGGGGSPGGGGVGLLFPDWLGSSSLQAVREAPEPTSSSLSARLRKGASNGLPISPPPPRHLGRMSSTTDTDAS